MNTSNAIPNPDDPRDLPLYRIAEGARYLGLPESTLRAWTFGQVSKDRRFQAVIVPSDSRNRLLSFRNLIEAHVLSSLRVHHRIPLPRIRRAVRFLENSTGKSNPLSELPLMTDGARLFVEAYAGDHVHHEPTRGFDLVEVSAEGQYTMRDVVAAYLSRVERDEQGVIRLFPFTRKTSVVEPRGLEKQPRIVVLDPSVSFGKPVLNGTNIRTSVIAERYLAGESIVDLAQDYRRGVLEIEEAIRSEIANAA